MPGMVSKQHEEVIVQAGKIDKFKVNAARTIAMAVRANTFNN